MNDKIRINVSKVKKKFIVRYWPAGYPDLFLPDVFSLFETCFDGFYVYK